MPMSRSDHKTQTVPGTLGNGWVWPRLLEGAVLAFRPQRVVMSLLLVVAIGLAVRIPLLWLGKADKAHELGPATMLADLIEKTFATLAKAVVSMNLAGVVSALVQLGEVPGRVFKAYPWSTLALIPIVAALTALLGGAVCRSAAVEFARAGRLTWTEALSFSLSRFGSSAASLLGPLVIGGILWGGVVLLGGAALSVPWLQVAGAALFGIALLLSFLLALLTIGYALGLPMLLPGVACEGTDAIDSVQRAYAYVLGRPLRLVLYLLVLVIAGVVVTMVLSAIAGMVREGSIRAAGTLLSKESSSLWYTYVVSGEAPLRVQPTSSQKATGAVLAFWGRIPGLLVVSWVVSYLFSAGTALYLTVRQANDGQDPSEIWVDDPVEQPAAATEPGAEDDDAN